MFIWWRYESSFLAIMSKDVSFNSRSKSNGRTLHCMRDDDDDDDDELFLWYGWPTKGVQPYFQPGPLSEILTIANLRHAVSKLWTCAEPEFRLNWMRLCSSHNHYNVPSRICKVKQLIETCFWVKYALSLKLMTKCIIEFPGKKKRFPFFFRHCIFFILNRFLIYYYEIVLFHWQGPPVFYFSSGSFRYLTWQYENHLSLDKVHFPNSVIPQKHMYSLEFIIIFEDFKSFFCHKSLLYKGDFTLGRISALR